MIYRPGGLTQDPAFVLNLIDTPGHVDFSYEVSRSLAACEGAVLLIDATQGIQAQTMAHFTAAKRLGLTIIPAVNKVDVIGADVDEVLSQIEQVLHFPRETILRVSGKTGIGVEELLASVIKNIPSPKGNIATTPRALVFNSNFDPHQGVIAWIKMVDGEISAGDKLLLLATDTQTLANEVGVFIPQNQPVNSLKAGEVGYVVTHLKDTSKLTVGDTLTADHLSLSQIISSPPLPLPGYQPAQPVVFVGLYPLDGSQINLMRTALGKLKLSDSSIEFFPESSPALGNGFRVGLLGLLHADIVEERLEREFGIELIASSPGVQYEIEKTNGQIERISAAKDLPDPSEVISIREPMISLSVFTPSIYVGAIMQLCQTHRAIPLDMIYTGNLVHLTYNMPFAELIREFYDQLKSVSAGFATIDYQLIGFKEEDLVKLDVLISGEKVDALAQIVSREKAPYIARSLVERLKDIIPRQQFEITIQVAIGGKILARADVKAFRKDVTAKLYGGDQTRKDKLLEKQKKGKKRMKRVGKIDIPQEALLTILKVD